jgi:2-dehydro-3-deoxyphosphogluconate aldolase / (4S)-4-hydroxy-2-oxoglutarate aldolase
MIPREVVSLMSRRRIVAEVRTETAMQALSVVDALAAGGVTTIEVSLTIPGAQEILTHLATRQDALVGAGAVLDGKQAREAIAAGARFVASPVFNPELALICQEASIACVLGALTPSEIIAAQRAGAEMVKLFPAEALGGPMYVRALLRQLTHMSLQISGGFSAEHMIEYLELPIRSLALGTLLVPRVLVDRGHWQAITNRARAFVDYAANPHAYAAQFLAMMGIGSPQAVPANPVNPRIANIPTMPVPPGMGRMIDPTVPETPSRSGFDPAASSSGFKPWDSRPVELGDDEDWLR